MYFNNWKLTFKNVGWFFFVVKVGKELGIFKISKTGFDKLEFAPFCVTVMIHYRGEY